MCAGVCLCAGGGGGGDGVCVCVRACVGVCMRACVCTRSSDYAIRIFLRMQGFL